MLTLTVLLLPFAILPIFLSLERIPRNLIEASADLGASPSQTFRRVILPLVAARRRSSARPSPSSWRSAISSRRRWWAARAASPSVASSTASSASPLTGPSARRLSVILLRRGGRGHSRSPASPAGAGQRHDPRLAPARVVLGAASRPSSFLLLYGPLARARWSSRSSAFRRSGPVGQLFLRRLRRRWSTNEGDPRSARQHPDRGRLPPSPVARPRDGAGASTTTASRSRCRELSAGRRLPALPHAADHHRPVAAHLLPRGRRRRARSSPSSSATPCFVLALVYRIVLTRLQRLQRQPRRGLATISAPAAGRPSATCCCRT